jgi:hypothetical protein
VAFWQPYDRRDHRGPFSPPRAGVAKPLEPENAPDRSVTTKVTGPDEPARDKVTLVGRRSSPPWTWALGPHPEKSQSLAEVLAEQVVPAAPTRASSHRGHTHLGGLT